MAKSNGTGMVPASPTAIETTGHQRTLRDAEAPAGELHARVAELRTLASVLIQRYQFFNQAGLSFGGKRDLYEILGYDRVLTVRQYRDRYARGGITGRIIDAFPKATWRGQFSLVETGDHNKQTAFETAWDDLAQRLKIGAVLARADILSQLSYYSVILLGAPGDFDTELPKGKPEQLLYLSPFAGGGGPGVRAGGFNSRDVGAGTSMAYGDATIQEFESDAHSPRFGLPTRYMLRRIDVTAPDLQRPVHWSRIIHIAEGCLDNEVYGQPRLERVWNLLDDLDKVTGGGAEAFWLRANQGLHLDIDKDMSLSDAEKALLSDQADEYQHQMRRMMRTRGVAIEALGSDVADFNNPADAIITQIAGALSMPKRILTGSEMGELASSQDRDNWKDQINGRQAMYAAPYIIKPLVSRLIDYGYMPAPAKSPTAYDVKWPHIEVLTEQEKADGAAKWATINSTMGMMVFSANELRDKWYQMDEQEDFDTEKYKAAGALMMAQANKMQGETLFTNDEIRKIWYGFSPLSDAEKKPIAAPLRESGNIPGQGKGNAPGKPVGGKMGKAVPLKAAGDVEGHPFHGNQWTDEGFEASPSDALGEMADGKLANVAPEDVRAVLEKAMDDPGSCDLTLLHVSGTPLFTGGAGVPRSKMPQIPKEHREEFFADIAKQGITSKKEVVDPMTLLPSQKEINAALAGEKLQKLDEGKKDFLPPIVSKDNYVLDGHHHWAAAVVRTLEHDKTQMPIIRLSMPRTEALRMMRIYARKKGYQSKALTDLAAHDDVELSAELLSVLEEAIVAGNADVIGRIIGTEVRVAGDKPGHEFHGNQYRKVGGATAVSDEDKMTNPSDGDMPMSSPIFDSDASSIGHTAATTQAARIADLEKMHYDEAARIGGSDSLISLQDSNTLYPDPTDKYSYIVSSTPHGTLTSQVFHGSGNVKHLWHDGEHILTGKKFRGAGDYPGHPFHGNQWAHEAAGRHATAARAHENAKFAHESGAPNAVKLTDHALTVSGQAGGNRRHAFNAFDHAVDKNGKKAALEHLRQASFHHAEVERFKRLARQPDTVAPAPVPAHAIAAPEEASMLEQASRIFDRLKQTSDTRSFDDQDWPRYVADEMAKSPKADEWAGLTPRQQHGIVVSALEAAVDTEPPSNDE